MSHVGVCNSEINSRLMFFFVFLFAGIITAWKCLPFSTFSTSRAKRLPRAIRPPSVWRIINAKRASKGSTRVLILAIKVNKNTFKITKHYLF